MTEKEKYDKQTEICKTEETISNIGWLLTGNRKINITANRGCLIGSCDTATTLRNISIDLTGFTTNEKIKELLLEAREQLDKKLVCLENEFKQHE